MTRSRIRSLYATLVAASALSGCGSPKGTLHAIEYETSLEGRYELVVREGGREHVWFPSDPHERFALSLRVQNPSAPVGEEPRCEDYGSVTWGHGFVPTPDGGLRNGTSVGTSLCAPSRPQKLVSCSVFWTHGEIARHEEKEPFVELCRGVILR